MSSNDPPPMETSTIPIAVTIHRVRITFAAYREDTQTIVECDTQQITERVIASIRPSLLLLSNKIVGDGELLAHCGRRPQPRRRNGR